MNTTVTYLMFTVVHEAIHCSISTAGWVNAVMGRLAWVFVAPMFSFSSFTFIHLAHHRYANDQENDPDVFATRAPLWQLPFRWAFTDVFYAVYYTRRLRTRRPAYELAETAVMSSLCIAVASAAAITGNLWTLAAIVVIPQRIGIIVLAWWFDWLPHHGLRDTAVDNRYRCSRARVGMGWLLTPLMLSQNYHVVHHVHPWIPWYRYRATWRDNENAYVRCDVVIETVLGRPLTAQGFMEWKRRKARRCRLRRSQKGETAFGPAEC
ncbi:hypothetical protein MBOT_38880 [Mycobacterium botniense]|uniref:Fatty acid desaturase domain-containing protein n=1 Tax=Mycobacterium botniense TaxID=84962 RepID=A0A7I9Y3Q7_9MYCO|nr:hypothetical protein MBOT_38880 [Mycobacterium botniense]